MKKYVKPVLIFEQFELSKHIADCAWELNHSEEECQALPDPKKLNGVQYNLFTTNCDVDVVVNNTLENVIYFITMAAKQ